MRPFSNLRRRFRGSEHQRGQSLVELALTLPVLLLLTLIALDFGRVYLGYINLQNMTRIATNFAANHPEAWGADPDAKDQARYRNQILADATATNCRLPEQGGKAVVPEPTFTDVNGDGNSQGLGDSVNVALTCTFDVITPGISNILGGTVAVGADSDFPVKAGMSAVANGGAGPVVGSIPHPAFSADTVISPDTLTVVGPTVSVEFRDTSGGAPTAWAWDFSDGTTSTLQDPLGHSFTCGFASCSYLVSMKASNILGGATAQMTVIVLGSSTVDFSANVVSGTVPLAVTFADQSASGGTAWAWKFGDGNTSTSQNPTHTYSAVGTYDVRLDVTYPSPVGVKTLTKTGFISVAVGTCNVPNFSGKKFDKAQGIWTAAGFTGLVSRGVSPKGNFTITAQSIVYSTSPQSTAPCSSNVTVSAP